MISFFFSNSKNQKSKNQNRYLKRRLLRIRRDIRKRWKVMFHHHPLQALLLLIKLLLLQIAIKMMKETMINQRRKRGRSLLLHPRFSLVVLF